MGAYLIAIPTALIVDIRHLRRRRRKAPSPQFVGTVCAGVALGTCSAIGFAAFNGARGTVQQAAIASFFVTALLFILKAFDRILRNLLVRIAVRRHWLILPAALGRIALLFGVGLPYVMAVGLTYRARVLTPETPAVTYPNIAFDTVRFSATDGTQLAGWWIPAIGRNGTRFSESTVIICHGIGIGKSSMLPLVGDFAPSGYNVLLFDFRAHGASDGQIVSFGDHERRDVLGAVQWLQRTHRAQSAKIYGIGIQTGGAALIAAAADPSPAGQAINAIAVYGCFDDLPSLTHDLCNDRFPPPFNWLFSHVGLALADIQSGANLTSFSPARLINNVWPRPVFIVSGSRDDNFPMESGRFLFEDAAEPKTCRWVNGATTGDLINDPETSRAVSKFFSTARPLPVI